MSTNAQMLSWVHPQTQFKDQTVIAGAKARYQDAKACGINLLKRHVDSSFDHTFREYNL